MNKILIFTSVKLEQFMASHLQNIFLKTGAAVTGSRCCSLATFCVHRGKNESHNISFGFSRSEMFTESPSALTTDTKVETWFLGNLDLRSMSNLDISFDLKCLLLH